MQADAKGVSHPRSEPAAEVLRMPDVNTSADTEQVFADARKAASKGTVIVAPMRTSWLTELGLISKPKMRKLAVAVCVAPPDVPTAVTVKAPPSFAAQQP